MKDVNVFVTIYQFVNPIAVRTSDAKGMSKQPKPAIWLQRRIVLKGVSNMISEMWENSLLTTIIIQQ